MLWILTNWRLVAAGAGILMALTAAGIIYSRIKDTGREEVRRQVEKHNTEATDAARKAREAHDLACARNEPGCLRDAWTRDRDR